MVKRGPESPQLCISLTGSDVDEAYRIVQNYAIAATHVLVGPRLWCGYGADAVRRLQMINASRGRLVLRFFLDARLYGTGTELADTIRILSGVGVSGVTIAASSPVTAIHAACQAATDISQIYKSGFKLWAYGVPEQIKVRRPMNGYRDSRMRRLMLTASAAGVDTHLVQPIDWTLAREAMPSAQLCVPAQHAMVDTGRNHGLGVVEWLRAGANVITYDPLTLCLPYQEEMDAELLRKEVESLEVKEDPASILRRRVKEALANRV